MNGTISNGRLIKFADEARSSLADGVKKLAESVKVTMGPKGKNVIIQVPGSYPVVTKDGVTVAKAVNFSEDFMQMGAIIAKEAAARTAEEAGDGTTTATVLTDELVTQGIKMIVAGHDTRTLVDAMADAKEILTNTLVSMSKPIVNNEDIVSIGTISANGEEKIGLLIEEAMAKVTKDGVITVEEAKGFDTSLEVVEGAQFEMGYVSPYFVNDHDKSRVLLKDPLIFVASQPIDSLKSMLPLLEKVHASNRALFIVAPDVSGDLLQSLVVNSAKDVMKVCAAKVSAVGDYKSDILQDIAALTGTEVQTAVTEKTVSSVLLEDLGSAKSIQCHKNKTVLIGSNGSKEDIRSRVRSIKDHLENPMISRQEAQLYRKRLAKLSGGVAILRVGGATEMEIRERRDRVDDALCATKAAVEEGILPGGGTALLRASCALDDLIAKGDSPSFIAGVSIVKAACQAPVKTILQNSGKTAEVIISKILSENSSTYGFDAKQGVYCDMIDSGIIDPLKVIRLALENAVSAAQMLLSVGCAMVNDEN